MSSQEEYLDQLLKDMMDSNRAEQDGPGDFGVEDSGAGSAKKKDRYEIEDLNQMSLDDINQILEKNSNGQKTESGLEGLELDALLEQSADASSKEIRDVLNKADNNEAVDERIAFLIEQEKEAGEELPSDLLEQLQEENEEESQSERKGFVGKLFGKKDKNKKKNASEKKKNEEFDYENIGLTGNLQLIDGDERNKKWFDRLKDKWKEKEEAAAEKKKKSKKKKQQTIEDALQEMEQIPEMPQADSANEEMDKLLDIDANEELLAPDAGVGQNEAVVLPEVSPDDLEELASIREKDEGTDPEKKETLESVETQSVGDGLDLALSQDLFGEIEPLGEIDAESENLDDLLGLAQKGEEKEKNDKKKGFFAKLFELLTEEDEEEKKDGESLILSDENDAILKELDKEDTKKKKKKKPKKGKGDGEEGEEGDEIPVKKGKKAKKEKKPKKQKELKTKAVEDPGKKLSKRRVQLIFMVCIAIGGAFLVLSNVTIDFSEKKKASEAFQEGDYEECYQNLVGKKLTESEQVMFGKSESILRIRLWRKEYEMLAEQGQEPEALDSLMQSVHDYPTLYAFSGKWNAVSEVQTVFDQMLEILLSKYGLTEEEAKIIANEEDDLLYSKMVRTIAGGGAFGDWESLTDETQPGQDGNGQGEDSNGSSQNADLLPEEEGLSDIPFAD